MNLNVMLECDLDPSQSGNPKSVTINSFQLICEALVKYSLENLYELCLISAPLKYGKFSLCALETSQWH